MEESLTIQKAYLLFEAGFCLIASFYLFINVVNADKKNPKNRIMMVSNFAAALLLIFDFFAYTFRGELGRVNFVMVRISNFAVFILTGVILYLYSMYVSFQLFGKGGITTRVPTQKRITVIYFLCLFNIVLITVTKITGGLYEIDDKNFYHRGPMYYVSVGITAIVILLVISILIQYRRHFDPIKFLSMISYVVLPGIAAGIQSLFYGFSFINIAIGFSLLLMFIENSASQSREIINVSKYDVRTGLFNEHGIIEKLNHLRSKKQTTRYAIVFFDIAKFSDINRKYGMKAGDVVLKEYPEKIGKQLNEDEFIGRQGSDHFIAVVRKENLKKIEEILSGTELEIVYGMDKKALLNISSVAGIYEVTDPSTKGEDLLANAYTALLYAKTVSNKPVDYMTMELREKIDHERQYGTMLTDGLERGEFSAFYQPKVNLEDSRLCGAEALARWIHDGSVINPIEFVSVMEKNDSVCSLDFYILGVVCRDIKGWMDKGMDIPVISVNFSRRNLANNNLAKDINSVVESYEVPKELIEIEITETNDEFPLSVLRQFVNDLHELGFKVAVDDFGCGSASLSLLREADFDTLKIDKSFIDNSFEKDLTILTHIINLAKAINMSLVAEGVENSWQQEKLQELGVGIVQGYFFDEPVTKEEMEKRIRRKVYERKNK